MAGLALRLKRQPSADPPRWLARLVWLGLLLVLTFSSSLALFVSAGFADPQRAGPLRWQQTSLTPWLLAPEARQQLWINTIIIPAPPFTLEISARFSEHSDPAAWWGVMLTAIPAAVDLPATPEAITVDGSGDYQHSPDPRRLPFPHLQPVGTYNYLTISVDGNGLETLRFNHEIAWRGPYSPGLQPTRVTIRAGGGFQLASHLTWAAISLYAPLTAITPPPDQVVESDTITLSG